MPPKFFSSSCSSIASIMKLSSSLRLADASGCKLPRSTHMLDLSPPAVSINSDEGRTLFGEALVAGTAMGSLQLLQAMETQESGTVLNFDQHCCHLSSFGYEEESLPVGSVILASKKDVSLWIQYLTACQEGSGLLRQAAAGHDCEYVYARRFYRVTIVSYFSEYRVHS
ncbi:hypothetical protein CRG98_039319 [Punica granatum]|uniref:Uncharacterized protein n=1 Tax=Punica granatum TaxID=22663 RepID=A0A2I0I8G9_PUNGR|nr:hypothetical protein CRG98_039319 [Punica granatum]